MKNINFDALTNIKAPDAWIENALDIPATVEKKKPILFFKHSRIIAAVACLILVSVVSVTIYLTSDRIVPPIDPNYNATEASISADMTYTPEGQDTTTNKEQNKQPDNAVVLPTGPHEAIEPPEDSSSAKPTQSTTTKPDSPQTPTERPIIGPTQPVEPSEPAHPTEPPFVSPTEDETPTEPSDDDPMTPGVPPIEIPTEEPTEEPTDEPTEKPTEHPANKLPEGTDCSGATKISNLTGQNRVYCIVTDPIGNQMGAANWFTDEHLATIYYQDGSYVYFAYSVRGHYNINQSGIYTCIFYNESGQKLFENAIYISK